GDLGRNAEGISLQQRFDRAERVRLNDHARKRIERAEPRRLGQQPKLVRRFGSLVSADDQQRARRAVPSGRPGALELEVTKRLADDDLLGRRMALEQIACARSVHHQQIRRWPPTRSGGGEIALIRKRSQIESAERRMLGTDDLLPVKPPPRSDERQLPGLVLPDEQQ